MRRNKVRFLKSKRKKEGGKFWRVVKLLMVFLLIFYVFFVYFNGYYKSYKKKKELKICEQKYHKLEKENKQLQLMIKRLKTDEEIERLAREIGLVKPNETSVRIVYPKEVKENSYKNITKKNKAEE